MEKSRRNTETAPQSKRRQGSHTDQQLVDLDSNLSLADPAQATTSQATTEVSKDQKVGIIEVDQNPEEEDFGVDVEIIRANRKGNYVERFRFTCCMCEHLLCSAMQSCNKCPHECCEDFYARRLPA
jgi:hypothetical protein